MAITHTKEACGEWGLDDKDDRIDRLIARPKESGLMSPELHVLTAATRARARLCELKLSLFRNKEGGSHE